jgi:ribosomal protein S27E
LISTTSASCSSIAMPFSTAFYQGKWHRIVACQMCGTTWEVRGHKPPEEQCCWSCGAGFDSSMELQDICEHERYTMNRSRTVLSCKICGIKIADQLELGI